MIISFSGNISDEHLPEHVLHKHVRKRNNKKKDKGPSIMLTFLEIDKRSSTDTKRMERHAERCKK